MVMAMISVSTPGRMDPAIAMASSTMGNAKTTSRQRMMIWSKKPRKYPATSPSPRPIDPAISVGTTPISREMRPPNSRRASMSRPCWSVPRRWPPTPSARSGRGCRRHLGRSGRSPGRTPPPARPRRAGRPRRARRGPARRTSAARSARRGREGPGRETSIPRARAASVLAEASGPLMLRAVADRGRR